LNIRTPVAVFGRSNGHSIASRRLCVKISLRLALALSSFGWVLLPSITLDAKFHLSPDSALASTIERTGTFVELLSLYKGLVINLFKVKGMKSSLCMLIMKRRGWELSRPGAARQMLDGGLPNIAEKTAQKVIDVNRFDRGDEVA